jgi:L-methionine (R)-S-oxide reductase
VTDDELMTTVVDLLAEGGVAMRAREVAAAVRAAGAYRWVGVYEVTDGEIAILGWSGEGDPAHPRFPRDRGLCGAAVASGATVAVDNVARDPRYLATFATTRSELVVPVSRAGAVRAVIDVESDRVAAFDEEDRRRIERVAAVLGELWED